MRAVLDADVLIAAAISPRGAPARLLLAWQAGAFELVVSPLLLAELRRALAYPKLARLLSADDANVFVSWLGSTAEVAPDPPWPPAVPSTDPGDDYLIALAAADRAFLVSGDKHLTALVPRVPVRSPAEFLAEIEAPSA